MHSLRLAIASPKVSSHSQKVNFVVIEYCCTILEKSRGDSRAGAIISRTTWSRTRWRNARGRKTLRGFEVRETARVVPRNTRLKKRLLPAVFQRRFNDSRHSSDALRVRPSCSVRFHLQIRVVVSCATKLEFVTRRVTLLHFSFFFFFLQLPKSTRYSDPGFRRKLEETYLPRYLFAFRVSASLAETREKRKKKKSMKIHLSRFTCSPRDL